MTTTNTSTPYTSNVVNAKILVHVVEITTVDGPVLCQPGTFVNDLRGARRKAKAMAKRFPCRILLGGAGGMEVERFERTEK